MKFDDHALLIGSMKCGTSTLFELLAQHPQIYPSRVKEPEFFAPLQDHRLTIDRYEDLWDDPLPGMVRLEGSTGYTKWPAEPGVPERIRAAGLNPRFIYIVRDPVRRIESHWNHLRKMAWFDLESGINQRSIQISRYHAQLARYRAVFPERERYLVLQYEELRDPAAIARRCFAFLGIDPDFAPEPRNANVTQAFSAFELRLERMGLARAGAWLPMTVKTALRSLVRRGEAAPMMTLDEAQRSQLRALLHEDMLALARDYDIDIGAWGFG